ncbi:TIGR01212 family radical SAM protein [Spirochaetota bacterium]
MKDTLPFLSLKNYFLNKYNYQVFRIPVDSHVSCPNIDGFKGTGGCIYCDAAGAASTLNRSTKSVQEQIREKKELHLQKGRKHLLVYFQTNTFTYRDIREMQEIIDGAMQEYKFEGFIISTRPDCLDADMVELLSKYIDEYNEVWVELGLQTIHDITLKKINRCHTYDEFLKANTRLGEAGIKTAAHMIIGLPSETDEMIEESFDEIGRMGVSGVKIHSIMVLKNTPLEEMYKAGDFIPITREKYIALTAQLLCYLPKETVIMRLSSDASPEYLTAPLWGLDKNRIRSDIIAHMQSRGLIQGKYR